jgi:hypothetical protein
MQLINPQERVSSGDFAALDATVERRFGPPRKQFKRCDRLVPGIAETGRWGVESGNLMYPSKFSRVQTCVYMKYRPNELLVINQQGKNSVL